MNLLITETGRYQCFTSGRPIRDSYGHIIGGVEIAKDMQAIKKLAKTISEPTARRMYGLPRAV